MFAVVVIPCPTRQMFAKNLNDVLSKYMCCSKLVTGITQVVVVLWVLGHYWVIVVYTVKNVTFCHHCASAGPTLHIPLPVLPVLARTKVVLGQFHNVYRVPGATETTEGLTLSLLARL